MRLKIKEKVKEKEEKAVVFFLEQDEEKVNLMVKWEGDENVWYLIDFRPDGTAFTYAGVPEEFGFDLDERGELSIGSE